MIQKHLPRTFLLTALLILTLLTACAVGPDFKRPETSVPAQWAGASQPDSQEARPIPEETLAHWWTVFNDATLNSLVQRAAAANLNLAAAAARIRQARAAKAATVGGVIPSFSLTSDYQHSHTIATSISGYRAGITSDQFQTGFDAGWEIDIFGGRRRSIEAADAQTAAAVESRRDVLVSLMAEVARDYIQLRTYQQQIAITRQNLKAQQHSAEITRKRFTGGFVSGLDVANAEAQTATTAAQIPLLESSVRQTIFSLSLLLGQPPAALEKELSPSAEIPAAPPAVPAGIPSQLLQRRPDIRQAEAQIHAATARVGVAKAEFFPKFTIAGSNGYRSNDIGSLFDWASRFWSVGPSMLWKVFQGGSLRANVEVQKALMEQEVIAYRQTILTALQEVENALVASTKEQAHRKALAEAVAANQKAVGLAERLYTDGLTDFINVLQSEQALYNTQNALVQSNAAVSTDLVALFKALGGGWPSEAETQTATVPDRPSVTKSAVKTRTRVQGGKKNNS